MSAKTIALSYQSFAEFDANTRNLNFLFVHKHLLLNDI